MNTNISNESQCDCDYDKEKEFKAFDDTKAGTKGLVDAGIDTLPKMFIQPADEVLQSCRILEGDVKVPVIDLGGVDKDGNNREKIVKEILSASRKWGFFHVVNHGIPLEVLEKTLEGVRMFHEQDLEIKREFYSRGEKLVEYNSNYDRRMKAANWKDTLVVNQSYADNLDQDLLPPIWRNAILDHTDQVLKLGNTIMELLSEALGLSSERLKEMECDKGWTSVYHYYPPCPQPELALGNEKHSDSSFFTVLLQDRIGGLQVLYEDQWVDVQPIPGGLLINIGDILQMISNDILQSVWHRVRVNRAAPRVSAAFFFTGLTTSEKIYGPIKELITDENPGIYKEFTIAEFIKHYFSRPLIEDRYKYFMIEEREQSN